MDGAVYFVTWRVRAGLTDLSDVERNCIVTAIQHFDGARYFLEAYVVMNDHVHVLVQVSPDFPLEEIVHSWKSFTANRLQRRHGREGTVWQQEYFDRVVRDDEEYVQKRGYILNNPRKRWPEIESYRRLWTIGVD